MTSPARGDLHFFGIRHHGPGSAHSLETALDAVDPVSLLIEGPPEADDLLRFAALPETKPPVALLLYAADEPALASFYPFAEYSPEWRAILWAIAHDRPVRFIDLPASLHLAQRKAERDKASSAEEEGLDEAAPEEQPLPQQAVTAIPEKIRADPLSYLAELAGWSDGEAWWNNLIEQSTHGPTLFAAIESAIAALREAVGDAPGRDAAREARREAHMRLAIAGEVEKVDGPIAVVTGAWHVPALRREVKPAEDRALLKDQPRIKTVATWVPWTDTRLAAASGYGAGVVSPGWYRHLWRELHRPRVRAFDRRCLTVTWQSDVARLLRGHDLPTATASVIEAVRLAEGLAALRDLSLPGLAEMQEASLAVLAQGESAPLRLVTEKLVIGDSVGEVAPDAPQAPLQVDLARQQKRLRLKPEALEQELSLDLRSDAGQEKSALLHRLALLDIPWGRLLDRGGSRGTFRERWTLLWTPELSVRVVEAVTWGTTVADAAANRAASRARELDEVPTLAELVSQCLFADLPEAARAGIARVGAAAVGTGDVAPLLAAVPPLATVLRYGTARDLPRDELNALVVVLAERICAGFVYQCRQLDESSAKSLGETASRFDEAMVMLEDERLLGDWESVLGRVATDDGAAAMLRGFALRRLYDRARLSPDDTAAHFSRALSPSVAPAEAGGWLDGFIGSAGQVLLHDHALRGLVDAFLMELDEAEFTNLLPTLRRCFAALDATERRRLMSGLREGGEGATMRARSADARGAAAFAEALPLLETILGLAP